MADIELIIKVPEEEYEIIKACTSFMVWAEHLIKNGTPLNEVLNKIRAEIDRIEINGQVDEHTMFIRTAEQVKQMALDIIDKYTKGESL